MSGRKKTFLSSLVIVGALMGGTVAVAGPPQAPSGVTAPGQEALLTHVTVSYTTSYPDASVENRMTYAVSQKTSREEKIWQARQQTPPSGKDVKDWLVSHGASLDREDGPAYIGIWNDGSTEEAYLHNGKLDRADGPAHVWCHADGSTEEGYFRDGMKNRENGPAVVVRFSDGYTSEVYYRDGKFIKEVASYYRDGKFVKQESPAPPSVITGPPTQPTAPKAPGASGPDPT